MDKERHLKLKVLKSQRMAMKIAKPRMVKHMENHLENHRENYLEKHLQLYLLSLRFGSGLAFLNNGDGIPSGKTSVKASGKTGRASVALSSKSGKAKGSSIWRRREEEPPRKRARTKDTLIPEKNWGPVSFKVVVPDVKDKIFQNLGLPEWKLKGQTLQMSMPLTDTVNTLKTKIMREVGMPQGKQKLQYKDVFLKDENTLAFYNMTPGTKLELKERSGRKK